jgi:hypothetical protein
MNEKETRNQIKELQQAITGIKNEIATIKKDFIDKAPFKKGDAVLVSFSPLGSKNKPKEEKAFISLVRMSYGDGYDYSFLKAKKDGTPSKHTFYPYGSFTLKPFTN